MLTPIGAFVQRADPERFVTTLFAPAAQRDALWTLYAFNHEIARAREVASQPTLALIRLHWWREVVEGAARAHEVATPLRAALAAGVLEAAWLHRMIDARELETEPSVDRAQWEGYLRDGAGALMGAAGRALSVADTGALERLGVGCGAAGLLRNAAVLTAAGRWSRPDGMDVASAHAAAVALLGPVQCWPAMALPAALPAVFARRFLSGGTGVTGGRLAVWAASVRRRC